MHHYYTGKSVNPPPANLRRRSRFLPARHVIYPPPARITTRPTTPLSLSSGNSQHPVSPKKHSQVVTASLSQGPRPVPGTDPLLPSISSTRNHISQTPELITEQDTHPPLPIEVEDNTSLRYQFSRIARGIGQLLKETPRRQRFIITLLGVVVLVVLSVIVNALIHFIDQFTNPIYVYSGIIASVTGICELIIKKLR